MFRPVGIALAAAVLTTACTSSPTVRGFVGEKGLGVDAGMRCPVAPTPPNRGASAGCGKAPTQALGKYARFSLTVECEADNARDRLYYVRLPPTYDPAKPYRTVYLGPGCGPPQDLLGGSKVYPMESASDPDAILIAMEQGYYNKAEYNSANCIDPRNADAGVSASQLCHFCFDDGAGSPSPDSAEYGYFDRLHKQIEADYCVDTSRQFYAGYSSGGWMAHQLGCQFPDVLRAQGSVTGGLPPSIHNGSKVCVDHPIAAFLIHDAMDMSNPYSGSITAVERLLRLNECHGDKDTAPQEAYMITGMPSSVNFNCVKYDRCLNDYPIVFCTSEGNGHDSQSGAAVPGFWEFFKNFRNLL
ncbi:MAG TPA: hypothetical protein VN903_34775 [Polyangia bacterium]|nr:hypothetical protein [Polyangia bacterium]